MKVSGSGCLNNTARDIMIDAVLNNEDLNFTKFYVSEFTDTFSRLVNPAIYSDFPDAKLIDTLSGDISFSGDVTPASSTVIESGSTILPINIKLLANAIPFDIQINTVFILAEDLRGAKIELTNSTEVNTYDIGDILEQGTVTAEITWKENEYLYVKDIDDGGSDGTYASFSAGAVTEQSGAGAGTLVTSVVSEVVVYSGCVSYDESIDIDVDTPANFNIGQYVVNDAGTPARAEITGKSGSTLTLSRVNTENFSLGDNLEEVADTTTAYSSSDGVTTSAQTTNTTSSTILPFVYNADGSVNIFKINLRFSSGFPTNLNFLNTSVQEIEDHNVSQYSHDGTLLRLDGANSPSSDIDWDSNKLTGLSDATVASDATNYGQITTLSSVSSPIVTLPLLVTDLSGLPFFIKHSYSRYAIANITQWVGPLGATLVIENLNGTEEVVIDLYGYDLDIGTPSNNKTNIKILNCTAPIKIINTNQLYTSAISQYNASTHNDSYPYEITTSNILIENSSNVTIGGDIGALQIECATSGNAVGIYANNSNVTLDHIYFKDGTVAVFSDHGSKIKMTRCMSTSGNLQEKALVCANGGEIYYRQHTKLTLTGVVGNFEIGEYVGEATPTTETFTGKIEGISGTTDNILWLYDAAGDISISSSFVGSSSGATGTKSAYDATKMQGSSGNYDIYFEGVGVVYTDCKYGYFNDAQEFELYSGISGDDQALFRNDGIGYIVDTGSYGATFYTFSGNWDVTGAGNVDNSTTYSSAVTSFADSPKNRIFPITMNIRRP